MQTKTTLKGQHYTMLVVAAEPDGSLGVQCRVGHSSYVQLWAAVFGLREPLEPLWSGSAAAFRRRWDALLCLFGVDHSAVVDGLTPGSLRGSGATFAYHVREDIPWIAWRGKWQRTQTPKRFIIERLFRKGLQRVQLGW